MHQLSLQYAESTRQGPVRVSEFRAFCQNIIKEEACKRAFSATKRQSDSRYWHLLRYGRITASNIYDAAHSKAEGGGILKEVILGASRLPLTKAMERGKRLEGPVFDMINKKLNLKIKKVGIMLHPDFPEFGASPDGITSNYVVEIKCPMHEKSLKNYIKDSNIAPKFLAQMHLQMKLCNKSKALFCVAAPDFEQSKEVTICSVDFDEKLSDFLINSARSYWEKYIFTTLMESVCR